MESSQDQKTTLFLNKNNDSNTNNITEKLNNKNNKYINGIYYKMPVLLKKTTSSIVKRCGKVIVFVFRLIRPKQKIMQVIDLPQNKK